MLSELARYTLEKYNALSYKRLFNLLFSKNHKKNQYNSDHFLDLNLDGDFDENGKVKNIKLIS
jgi:hypothetical protein